MQRELLGRGEQDVRRVAALALALRGRRVAGAGLDADRQAHLGDRRLEVARDVDRERLERRDVERVQPALAAQIAAGGDERRVAGLPSCANASVTACARCLSVPSPLWGRDGRGVIRIAATPSPALPQGGRERSVVARAHRVRCAQLHQRRQKSRQRLAGAGRRDQQHRAAGPRLGQQLELMRARRPAAAREPARERLRQRRRRVDAVEQRSPTRHERFGGGRGSPGGASARDIGRGASHIYEAHAPRRHPGCRRPPASAASPAASTSTRRGRWSGR